jgi:hypothetical protein
MQGPSSDASHQLENQVSMEATNHSQQEKDFLDQPTDSNQIDKSISEKEEQINIQTENKFFLLNIQKVSEKNTPLLTEKNFEYDLENKTNTSNNSPIPFPEITSVVVTENRIENENEEKACDNNFLSSSPEHSSTQKKINENNQTVEQADSNVINNNNNSNQDNLHKKKVSKEDFEMLGSLGKGSFGEVHLVRKIGGDEFYAMKGLDKHFLFKVRKQFIRNKKIRKKNNIKSSLRGKC